MACGHDAKETVGISAAFDPVVGDCNERVCVALNEHLDVFVALL